MSEARKAESNGGEGRIRTFEAARATDLQSAAFDRFATSPNFVRVFDPVNSFVNCLTPKNFGDISDRSSGAGEGI